MADILTAGPEAYKRAADILERGDVVGLPTETVYGLAGDAGNDVAVRKIYSAKGRPAFNPLIAHVLSPDDAGKHAEISATAQSLIDAFWPGPLTLVLPRRGRSISDIATTGLPTLAIRCPDVPWRTALHDLGVKGPLVMPSANVSGHISPTTAAHVAADLGDKIQLIIDGGPCQAGVESTILKIEEDYVALLRPGTLSHEDLLPYVADLRLPESHTPVAAPGMLSSHYAPKAKVRLDATDKKDGEAFLAFGPTTIEADMNLSEAGNLAEAARHLYTALRTLDDVETIAVAPIPETGIGIAINDRLRRAAADR